MRILFSWLKEYIDLDLSPTQVAKILTMAGLEVDGIESLTAKCQGVVVCEVKEVEKHPQADKLCIALVDDGQQKHQVVCGAPNCRVGIKTALALPGATVFNEQGSFKVKKSKLRGIESSGMLCSEDELGLQGIRREGIIEFDERISLGADVAGLFSDTLFEISLTPNLGHCSSLIGVARELSAATETHWNLPEITFEENAKHPIESLAKVEIKNLEACPRYACRLIKNVSVGPSPDWLKSRLEASGMRSINNIVDITNYVMLEMGHPLHAFDYQLLDGQQIVVRNAHKGEKFTTLDSKERMLVESDLLICDRSKPVALAGVMGGMNSEVTDQTRDILLEAAFFNPKVIRRTSKRLGLSTDASKRFERGTDPNILITALDRAAMLIQELAKGEVCKGVIDIATGTFKEKQLSCRLSRINQILGAHISLSEVESIFQRLNFKSHWDGQNLFKVIVPTYRNDILEEIDLIEEVARLYGYDNFPHVSAFFQASTLPHAPIFLFEREMRTRLIGEGLQEFLTCDLIGPTLLNIVQDRDIPEETLVKVLNPTSIEQSVLRTSLLPGLLQVMKYNWDHQNHDIAGFEIGRIHFKDQENFKEQSAVAVVLSGKGRPSHWERKPTEFDFYDLKGLFENLVEELKVKDLSFKESHLKTLHPGRQAAIFSGSLQVGSFGEVHPSILRRLDLPQRILFGEINLHDLYQVKSDENKMQEIPKFPCSERDWTLTLKEEIPLSKVFEAISTTASKLLEKSTLLDIYRSDKLGKGVKNVTFRFVYRDWNKTIDQEKVDKEHARMTSEVLKLLQIG